MIAMLNQISPGNIHHAKNRKPVAESVSGKILMNANIVAGLMMMPGCSLISCCSISLILLVKSFFFQLVEVTIEVFWFECPGVKAIAGCFLKSV